MAKGRLASPTSGRCRTVNPPVTVDESFCLKNTSSRPGLKHRIFVAGGNGKLAVIDTQSGKITGSTDIVTKVDQIAFDPAKQFVYCTPN
jgi:hypothetical protein